MSTTEFPNIYLNQSRFSGRMRLSSSGLGWKADKEKVDVYLLNRSEVTSADWSRGSRGYMIRISTNSQGVVKFDGFDIEQLDSAKAAFRQFFEVNLTTREHAVKGWNWGQAEFERSELVFTIADKPAFELAYEDIANSNLVAKNEVGVEFNLAGKDDNSRAGDELVEMRFYIPGVVAKEEGEERVAKKEHSDEEDGEKMDVDESEEEEQTAAQAFYENIADRAKVGTVAGEALVTFGEIMFLTPRGKYDILMYETSFNLRGKTYDYKVQYKNIQRMFLLPRPDDTHNLMVIQLSQPLRQGQTTYPFLVIQFDREDPIKLELNVEDDEYEAKYKGKVEREYDEAAHRVVGQLFKGLSGKKTIFPSDFTSSQDQAAVNCSHKANEGYLYPLDKCFLFLPKPTLYIPYSEVAQVTFSRVSGAVSSSRTFDMTISLKSKTEVQFSNIQREEQSGLESFIKSRGVTVRDDVAERQALIEATLAAEASDSEEEVVVDRGSADEDEESPDEDFEEDDEDSDIAEEFDENAASDSASGSEMEDEGDAGEDEEEPSASEDERAPPKKKARK